MRREYVGKLKGNDYRPITCLCPFTHTNTKAWLSHPSNIYATTDYMHESIIIIVEKINK